MELDNNQLLGFQFKKMNLRDFKLFSIFIYKNAGINITEKKLTLLSNRIRTRLRALNINSYKEYYTYLNKSPDKEIEIIKMIDAVTTNVTHFFRNPKQFIRFQKNIIPEILKNNEKKKKLNILSAGCSSGEEPYTIAIILLHNFYNIINSWDVQITGIDISAEIIDQAIIGEYNKKKLENVYKLIVNKYLNITKPNIYKIKNEVKKIVTFKKFNLLSDNFISHFDVIFCRNVVIYFDKPTKNIIYHKFHKALNKTGYLLIGHSEGLINDFRFKYLHPGIYIKKESKHDI